MCMYECIREKNTLFELNCQGLVDEHVKEEACVEASVLLTLLVL